MDELDTRLGELISRYETPIAPADEEPLSGVWAPAEHNPVEQRMRGLELELVFPVPEAHQRKPVPEWGWRQVDDMSGLLQDFIRVESLKQAQRFAQRWGPLWLLNPESSPKWERFWDGRPYRPEAEQDPESLVAWSGFESIDVWLSLARRARAATEVATAVSQGHVRIPNETWRRTGLPPHHDRDPQYAEADLSRIINYYLVDLRLAPSLRLVGTSPRLAWRNRCGFLPTVWLEIARIAAGGVRVYVCADCQDVVVLEAGERAPRNPQRAFCPACQATGQRAVKREHHNRRRAELQELALAVVTMRATVFTLAVKAGEFPPPLRTEDLEVLRIRWNDLHPERVYYSFKDMVDDLRQAQQGAYRALNEDQREILGRLLARLDSQDIDDDLRQAQQSADWTLIEDESVILRRLLAKLDSTSALRTSGRVPTDEAKP